MDYIFIAQLENTTVVGVSMLKKSGFVKTDNQIVIGSLDESLLGKIYDAETGTFKEA
jgi:hypothetical protein